MAGEIDRVSPKKVQEAKNRGFKRLANFRRARVAFIQEYVGPYYDKSQGECGTSALNLIFNAIRVLLPNLVANFPKHSVMTPYLQARQYSKLLALALDQNDLKINIKNTYRAAIVDALFTLGILKTGLAASGSVYAINDEDNIAQGEVFTEKVDFDNFVVDPESQEHMFRDARFMGDRITVPRQMLLDSGLYKNDLIERLPRLGNADSQRNANSLSMHNIQIEDNYDLEDEVSICELWVPSANAVITVPGDDELAFDDYLRIDDWYGVKEGPYSLLSFSPPVPGNPMPVPVVGVWYDLHVLANRMAKKVVEQAERQKDILTYKRGSADDAEELKNAGDGEAIAVDDPDGVTTHSFGGQKNSNEVHLGSLMNWFNQMASNPEQLGGQQVTAPSATGASILQQNAAVGLEDCKDMVYQLGADEARKRAWYFHTDPLIKIPLTQRTLVNQPMPQAPWLTIPTMQDVQVILTPEARSGDFLDYVFTIQPESMGRRDSKTRLAQAQAFAQQVMPAVITAATAAAQIGIPFNALAFLLRMGEDMGIEWLDEVLFDPTFQMQMAQQMQMGPQAAASKGQPAPAPNAGLGGILQNGQPGQVRGPIPGEQQQFNQQAQQGANGDQQMMRTVYRGAFHAPSGPAPLANANAM